MKHITSFVVLLSSCFTFSVAPKQLLDFDDFKLIFDFENQTIYVNELSDDHKLFFAEPLDFLKKDEIAMAEYDYEKKELILINNEFDTYTLKFNNLDFDNKNSLKRSDTIIPVDYIEKAIKTSPSKRSRSQQDNLKSIPNKVQKKQSKSTPNKTISLGEILDYQPEISKGWKQLSNTISLQLGGKRYSTSDIRPLLFPDGYFKYIASKDGKYLCLIFQLKQESGDCKLSYYAVKKESGEFKINLPEIGDVYNQFYITLSGKTSLSTYVTVDNIKYLIKHTSVAKPACFNTLVPFQE